MNILARKSRESTSDFARRVVATLNGPKPAAAHQIKAAQQHLKGLKKP